MPFTLTPARRKELQTYLDNGNIDKFYSSLKDEGYYYAGWADGVASENTITGNSAIDFLKESGLIGAGNTKPGEISPDVLDKIKRDMAQGYLDKLNEIGSRSEDGMVNRDVSADETR